MIERKPDLMARMGGGQGRWSPERSASTCDEARIRVQRNGERKKKKRLGDVRAGRHGRRVDLDEVRGRGIAPGPAWPRNTTARLRSCVITARLRSHILPDAPCGSVGRHECRHHGGDHRRARLFPARQRLRRRTERARPAMARQDFDVDIIVACMLSHVAEAPHASCS